MAKEKSTEKLAKEERKAARKAEKRASRSSVAEQPTGVTKTKSDKKDKKEKRKVLAEKVLNSIDDTKPPKGDGESDGEEAEDVEMDGETEVEGGRNVHKTQNAALATKPTGPLVPFANPLADEKVAKKVFKGVKKGMAALFSSSPRCLCHFDFPRLSLLLLSLRKANTFDSRGTTDPEERCQGGGQGTTQISRLKLFRTSTHRCRRLGRRHLPHGRHLPHPRVGRGPQHSLHLRDEPGGVGSGGADETTDQRGHDQS